MVVGEFSLETDLVVIGGGPGGYTTAFRAAELGITTAIVDPHSTPGGVCLHRGCIPSKTLLAVADTLAAAQHAQNYGVHFDSPKIDLDQLRSWIENSINQLGSALKNKCDSLGIEWVQGHAAFASSRELSVPGAETPRIKFRRAVIATGARANPHSALPFPHPRVMSPYDALTLESIPESLLVVGAHFESLEIASIYAALGSRVTLIDEHPSFLPQADPDLSRPLHQRLQVNLDHIALETTISTARISDENLHISFSGPENNLPPTTTFDAVVVTIGHHADFEAIHLDQTQVRLTKDGFILTNDQLQTTDPRIYAVGDVTGHPLFADKAIHQARVCAEAVAGWGTRFDPRAIPQVAFTDPQIAWCGLTEAEARSQNHNHHSHTIPWGASGRAVGLGRTDGLTKIIFDPDSQLVLGVGVVGPGASEMIGEAVLALEMGAVLTDIAASIHPHPSMSELLSDAARQAEQK